MGGNEKKCSRNLGGIAKVAAIPIHESSSPEPRNLGSENLACSTKAHNIYRTYLNNFSRMMLFFLHFIQFCINFI